MLGMPALTIAPVTLAAISSRAGSGGGAVRLRRMGCLLSGNRRGRLGSGRLGSDRQGRGMGMITHLLLAGRPRQAVAGRGRRGSQVRSEHAPGVRAGEGAGLDGMLGQLGAVAGAGAGAGEFPGCVEDAAVEGPKHLELVSARLGAGRHAILEGVVGVPELLEGAVRQGSVSYT